MTMKSGKIDHFCDELMRLALELGYRGNFVKDKARVGITTDLRNAWALKTPLPDQYVEYINLLRQTGHQLEDVASFNRTVTKGKHHSRPEKSDHRQSSAKKQRKDRKSSGPRQQKPRNHASGSSRPEETEHTKMHRDISHTLIDKRKQLNQCSRCGQVTTGHSVRRPLLLLRPLELIEKEAPVKLDTKPPKSRNRAALKLLRNLLLSML